MDVDGFVNRLHAESERSGGIEPSTSERYEGYIRLFEKWAQLDEDGEPTPEMVRKYVEYLAYDMGLTNQTIRVRMSPIIRYARYAGLDDAEFSRQWEQLRSDFKPSGQDTPTFLDEDAVEAMKDAACPDPEGVADVLDGFDPEDMSAEEREFLRRAGTGDEREYAIISLLAATGIRVGELCGLTLDDIELDPKNPPSGDGLVGYVTVERQKRKEMAIDRLPITAETAEALRSYVSVRDEYLAPRGPEQLSDNGGEARIPADESEALFVTSSWADECDKRFGDGWTITPQYVRHLVKKVARRAGVEVPGSDGRDVYPHLFRHTAASRLAQAGYSNVQIANWLGVEPSTADIYADISEQEMGEMADEISGQP